MKSVVKSDPVKHEELTREIIGAAMAVLNELKPGLDEKLYLNITGLEVALLLNFQNSKLDWKRVVRGPEE